MPNSPIQYYNRYTQSVQTEQIYGESFIRWSYTTHTGNLFINLFSKMPCISKTYGYLMDSPSSKKKIAPFIEQYQLNPNEFEKNVSQFTSFNDFFYRKLKPSARPIDPNPHHAVFPADGRHFGFQNISSINGVFLKGQTFDLPTLLASHPLAEKYKDGSLILSRLCPTDYHRFHFPSSGTPLPSNPINGPLHSVNPLALRRNLKILSENRRQLTTIETDIFGPILMLEVGAICVGSIIQTFTPNQPIAKGTEKGFFRFGGSSTILLFEKNRIKLADDLIKQSLQNRELYAHIGDFLGSAL